MKSRTYIGCLLLAMLAAAGCKPSTKPASPTAASPSAALATSTPVATTRAVATPAATPRPGSTAAVAPSTTVVSRVGEPGLFTITATGSVVPESIAVQAGRTVSFQNNDAVPHRFVSDEPNLFDTGVVAPGARATVQVRAPGTHDWHDVDDPRLHGTVRVLQ